MDEIATMKALYPNIKYVATVWIVQDENDKDFNVRVWDEWNDCSDEPLERACFPTWEAAQLYIEDCLYKEYPDIYFRRDFDMDTFAEN